MRSVSKALRFPLGGIAANLTCRDTTYPREDSVYSTPMAVNVIGECSFSSRLRGGSRPGLVSFSAGSSPAAEDKAEWLWPNGERILIPSGESSTEPLLFDEDGETLMPDGRRVVNPHASLRVTATKGAIPDTPSCFAFYRDRFALAADNLFFFSRTTDHGDFDYGGEAEDPTRPVAGQIADAGRKGERITALCPVADSRIYIATDRRLAVIEGEPTGGIATLSDNTGIISRDAWCNADGSLYFLGQNGLYAIGEEGVMNVSGQIPEELKGLDSAVLVYDPERRGIHLLSCRRTIVSDSTPVVLRSDYFYDIQNRAFWPLVYPAAKRPTMGGSAVVGGVNRAIFLCADGEWRFWSDNATSDDGSIISSSVAIGPFKCGTNDDVDGLLAALTVTLATGSAAVSIDGYMGQSAEDAYNRAKAATDYDFRASAIGGWNEKTYPRARGAWCVMKLNSYGRWAYESIKADIKVLGGLRNG